MADVPVVTDAGSAATLFHDPRTSNSRDIDFLDAYVRYGDAPIFRAQTRDAAAFDDFVARVAAVDERGRPCRHVEPGDVAGMDAAPVLVVGGRSPVPFAWRRRGLEARRYSIAAQAPRIDLDSAAPAGAELILAPLQPWDALIVETVAERGQVMAALQRWSDYIVLRTGGGAMLEPVVTIVPPGVDCAVHAEDIPARAALRRRLGIEEEDVVVLTAGAFSVHARAHPMSLYCSLELAAGTAPIQGRGRLRLIQAGWFDSEGAEREFREALRRFAPSVDGIFLDGRDADVRAMVWHAADIYAAMSDSAAVIFDQTLPQAMAAGLPVVAADWGGNREAVRDGIDGMLVPTWLPIGGSGPDLAASPETRLDQASSSLAAAQQLGMVGQCTAVDVGAAAHAFVVLAGDAALRNEMASSARTRAREVFDWRQVIANHRDVWRELSSIRNHAPEVAPAVPGTPDRPPLDDPFSALAPLAAHIVEGDTIVDLSQADMNTGESLRAVTRVRMNDFAMSAMLDGDARLSLLDHLRLNGASSLLSLAEIFPEAIRYRLPRTITWMAKLGLLTLRAVADEEDVKPSLAGASTGGGNLIDLGVAARRRGADDAAAQYLQSALHQQPDDARAHAEMGALLASHADLDGAVTHLRHAVSRDPGMTSAHRDLGKALFLRGDRGEGIAALQRAVELDAEDAEAHYLLGAALRRAGAANEAVHALEASLARDPRRVDALCHLGMARKSLGRRAEAMQAFRDALTVEPGNVFARAAELSLGMEREGRRRFARDPRAKRVVLHLNDAHHFPLLRRLFEAFSEVHWPLISGDGREVQEFQPQVVVVTGDQARAVRDVVPDSTIVYVPPDLAGRRRAQRAYPGADYICVPSPFIGNTLAKRGVFPSEGIWVTGFPGLDAVFSRQRAGSALERPAGLGDGSLVVYAPVAGRHLSSAPMLAGSVAESIRGPREDITVVVLADPKIVERHPAWLADWYAEAARVPNMAVIDDPQADPMPWLAAADVLVSDASGLAFSYLAFDRPIVLLTNPEHAREQGAFDPDGIEWRWRDVGEEVHRADELASAVEAALADPATHADTRARYRGLLFGDMGDGLAVARIIDAVAGL